VIYTQNGATCLLQMAAEADPTRPKIISKKGIACGQETSQVHIMEGSIDHKGPFVLDLDGLSKPAAQLALQHVRCNVMLPLHAHCGLALSCCQHQHAFHTACNEMKCAQVYNCICNSADFVFWCHCAVSHYCAVADDTCEPSIAFTCCACCVLSVVGLDGASLLRTAFICI